MRPTPVRRLNATLPEAALGAVVGVVLRVDVAEVVVELPPPWVVVGAVVLLEAAEEVIVVIVVAEVMVEADDPVVDELASDDEVLVLATEEADELLLLLPFELCPLILMLFQVPDWSPYEYSPASVAPWEPM